MFKKLIFLTLTVSTYAQLGFASSFVYEDVLAYPRYHVILSENEIPESVALNNKKTEDQVSMNYENTSKDTKKKESVMMMSAYGQPFLCTLPNVNAKDDEKRQQLIKEQASQENTHGSIEKGLDLLEPLSKGCLYFALHSYWTYEYCHRKHVRQFHEERLPQGENEKTEVRREVASYYLGVYPGQGQAKTPPQTAEQGLVQQNTLQYQRVGPKTTLRHVGDKPYLVQKWSGGTECDITKEPRTIEIQYHCDMQANDRITMFQEVKTCQYQMVISTPRLCEEFVSSPQSTSNSHAIDCSPVVPDAMYVPEHEKKRVAAEAERAEAERAEAERAEAERAEAERVEAERAEAERAEADMLPREIGQEIHQTLFQETRSSTPHGNTEENSKTTNIRIEELQKAIAQLSDHIDDLNHKLHKATSLQKTPDSEKETVAYFHLNEHGNLVPVDPASSILLKSLQNKAKSNIDYDSPEKVPENQKKNKLAYEKKYF
ncbi:hypothetical protein BDF14DRAFT_1787101 [Spinellus fusiger]|nr:hypothetical protein BDF14DRAFT_1787101 [Spinellus fusiger]